MKEMSKDVDKIAEKVLLPGGIKINKDELRKKVLEELAKDERAKKKG